VFNLVGVNDYDRPVGGEAVVKLLDARGREVSRHSVVVSIPAYGKQYIPTKVELPEESGGYVLLVEYMPDRSKKTSPVLSRRYIKVGKKDKYAFYDYEPERLRY